MSDALAVLGSGKPDEPTGKQTAELSMKKIVLLLLAIFAIILTGCTEKYNCHFHLTANSFYNYGSGYQPVKTEYGIDITNSEYGVHEHYNRVCQDGKLDFHVDLSELKGGEYTIKVRGSIYITSIGRYVTDEATCSVIVGLYDDNYFEKDFNLYLN